MNIDLGLCLEKLGLAQYYWGPDISSYESLSARWPSENPTLPSESELLDTWDSIKDKVAWSPIRQKRNRLLLGSDWTQIPDSECDKQAWANYRKELRGLPQKFQTPEEVIWPVPPA
jgi:hypothetical protein